MSPVMTITLNGQSRDLPPGAVLRDLVVQFAKCPDVVVAELNGAIVDRQNWEVTRLVSGDRVELVAFVGGG